MPNGIAVTSSRPVRRMSFRASHGKNAERGPRHHALEHEVGRELEDADQQ